MKPEAPVLQKTKTVIVGKGPARNGELNGLAVDREKGGTAEEAKYTGIE